ncbi:MAG: hypothetical protein WCE91_07875, partial [Nitrososphaeraceae archaeon]
GIIIFVGGLRYTFDIIVDTPRVNTDTFAIGGAIAICLGLAPLIYGIVTFREKSTATQIETDAISLYIISHRESK